MKKFNWWLVLVVLLSLAPLSLIVNVVPHLITSDYVVLTDGMSGYAVWLTERHLGWALLTLNLILLCLLWLPFRKRERWSLLPLWLYLGTYIGPQYCFISPQACWSPYSIWETLLIGPDPSGMDVALRYSLIIISLYLLALSAATGVLLYQEKGKGSMKGQASN